MSFVFLKAEWNNLIIANYVIDPKLLVPYLPPFTELDIFNGETYVSLVGFMFNNTRILGLKIPFHINFEEVNLRFYVRYKYLGKWRRGVVFIKEIVPKYAITYIANSIYREKYATMKMAHSLNREGEDIALEYLWKHIGHWNKISVLAANRSVEMVPGSEEEFIAQHYYGYSKFNQSTTYEYEVQHNSWEVYPVKKYAIDCDFLPLYGPDFSFLKQSVPSSVFLAKGSPVTIYQKRNITSLSLP